MSGLKNESLEMLKEPGLWDDELRRRLLEVLLEPVQPRKMTYHSQERLIKGMRDGFHIFIGIDGFLRTS